jgi:hypothetical protein
MKNVTFKMNGINIDLMEYSNKGIIILVNDGTTHYRIKVTIVNKLKIEVSED